MKPAIAAASAAAMLVAFALHPSAQPSRAGLTIEQLVDIRHPSAAMWAPDGRHVVFVWERAGVSAIYVADASISGAVSAPRQLADAGNQLAGAFWSADGSALMIPRNGELRRVPIDGSRFTTVWTHSNAIGMTPSADRARIAFVAGKEIRIASLADKKEIVVAQDDRSLSGLGWSPDGTQLIFVAGNHTIRHEQTPQYSGSKIIYTINENVPGRAYVVPASGGGTPKELAGAGGGGFGGQRRWLDARHFLVDRTSVDFKHRTIAAIDVAGSAAKILSDDVEEKFWSITGDAGANAQVSPDGKWVLFLSARDGWDHLYVMPAAGGAAIQITKGKFEAWRPQWSPDGTRIAFDANSEGNYGNRQLYLAIIEGTPAQAKIVPLTTGRGTNIGPQWSTDGKRLVYQHTDPHNSADLFVTDVPDVRGIDQFVVNSKPVRLTDSLPAAIDRSAFVEPEMVSYPGPDGKTVPAWLFVPKNLDRSKKHPAIVWIHGDCVNQNYDGWHVQRNYAVYYSFHQYLLQKGYVVIAPDYRGSIGYGKAWREAVHMDVGGNDAKDAWMAANYLKTLNYVDADRLGVWGLSYGGFFTLIAVTDQPKLYRAAVDVAGVVDYAMYYEDPYHGGWTASRIGTPEEHPQVYAQASPLSHIDRLANPLLILHGTSDVNVPYLHSVRLIDEALKKGKGDLVSFMTYPGEFHYFTREHVLKDAWHRVDDFFAANLKP
jgi:dipeptidyl aminopeptidase/acylaminoacyl peptidase